MSSPARHMIARPIGGLRTAGSDLKNNYELTPALQRQGLSLHIEAKVHI
jgi:hypothetical protein